MIYSLQGYSQHYAWGGRQYIPTLFKQPCDGQPYAEWWLGAHPAAPSIIQNQSQRQSLIEFLQQNPTALGDGSRAKFGDDLPFLVKILDVEKPLSIQLHPNKTQAEIGFAAENAAGIEPTDTTRIYKDNNHKPEMMIALSDFWLLHGFCRKAQIMANLAARPSLAPLAKKLTAQPLSHFYADMMHAKPAQLARWLLPIIEVNQTAYRQHRLNLANPDYWMLYTVDKMAIEHDKLDAGLLCFYLFNLVHLNPGEGIYQAAGIPHAYLRGQNIELMACSDNVIRGGLTPKYVNIDALLDIIDCREIIPQIIPAAPISANVHDYLTPASDFALQRMRYEKETCLTLRFDSAAILLVMKGVIEISQNSTALCFTQGESAFIEAGEGYQLKGIDDGYCFIAQLPPIHG